MFRPGTPAPRDGYAVCRCLAAAPRSWPAAAVAGSYYDPRVEGPQIVGVWDVRLGVHDDNGNAVQNRYEGPGPLELPGGGPFNDNDVAAVTLMVAKR